LCLCVGVSVWLGWGGICVADCSTVVLVCWSFGVSGLEWYPCSRLKHNIRLQVFVTYLTGALYVHPL